MSNFPIEFDGVKYSIEVSEKSSSWGKGIKLSIFNPDGTHLNSVSYSCHPEFAQYKMYQSKTIDELTKIALSRIARDMDTMDFRLATENGIKLQLPINNVYKHNNHSQGDAKNARLL